MHTERHGVTSKSPDPRIGPDHYLQRIHRFPYLSPEEELSYARRFRETQNAKAKEKLAASHLRLVAKIARGYMRSGLPLEDLISAGNVGLVQAINKFDPDLGFRLATYAPWWIRSAIKEHILEHVSLVKVSAATEHKKVFFNLSRLKGQMGVNGEGDLSPKQVTEIAQKLHVAERVVVRMNQRLSAPDCSLDMPVKPGSDTTWKDLLVDEDGPNPLELVAAAEETTQRNNALMLALRVLTDDRERHILTERRLKDPPTTFDDLSRRFGVSRERIRQLEVRALKKLQTAVRAQMAEMLDAEPVPPKRSTPSHTPELVT